MTLPSEIRLYLGHMKCEKPVMLDNKQWVTVTNWFEQSTSRHLQRNVLKKKATVFCAWQDPRPRPITATLLLSTPGQPPVSHGLIICNIHLPRLSCCASCLFCSSHAPNHISLLCQLCCYISKGHPFVWEYVPAHARARMCVYVCVEIPVLQTSMLLLFVLPDLPLCAATSHWCISLHVRRCLSALLLFNLGVLFPGGCRREPVTHKHSGSLTPAASLC